jgi:hypothetical protein
MAWEAELVASGKDVSNVGRIFVDVRFYDDAAPGTTLHFKQFHFPPATTNNDMRRAVEDEGKQARATYDRSVTLATAFPPGSTIDIPA